jgi:hypothetical protein
MRQGFIGQCAIPGDVVLGCIAHHDANVSIDVAVPVQWVLVVLVEPGVSELGLGSAEVWPVPRASAFAHFWIEGAVNLADPPVSHTNKSL